VISPSGSASLRRVLLFLLALACLLEPIRTPGSAAADDLPILRGNLVPGDGTTADLTQPAPVTATPQDPCSGNTVATRARPDGSYEISSNLVNGCEYAVGGSAGGYFSDGDFVRVNGETEHDFILFSNKAWLAGSVFDATNGEGLALRGGDVFTPVTCDGINPNCFSTADGNSYAFGNSPGLPGQAGGLPLERPPGAFKGPGQHTFTIVASHPGYFSETTQSLTLVSGQIVSGHDFSLYPSQGNIRGTVLDAISRQPIAPEFHLTVTATAVGSTFSFAANLSGESYTFASPSQPPDWGLPVVRGGTSGPGSQQYVIGASAQGYDRYNSDSLLVTSGRSTTHDILLYPAGQQIDQGPCGEKSCEHNAGSPINLTNGNTWIQQQDYSLPGLGGGLELTRTWNSQWQTSGGLDGMFGPAAAGWRSNYEERLNFPRPDTLKYWRGDGSAWLFRFDALSGTYALIAPPDERALLEFDTGTTLFTLTLRDGSKKIFNNAGFLVALEDRNGNRTTLSYDGFGRLAQVTDPAGRWLEFTYGPGSLFRQVASVQDATGVIASYSYSLGLLTQVRYADNSALTLIYGTANLITAVRDTEGKLLEAHTYDSSRRGLTSERADGVDRITVSYPFPGLTRLTDSRGNTTEYRYFSIGPRRFVAGLAGPGCASCGGRGNQSFAYDASGNRTASTDALDRTTRFRYDAMGNVTERSVELGPSNTLTWSYTYNNFGQVVTATDPLGNTTTNTYDSRGNLLSTTTPSPDGVEPGSTTSFEYDARGQLIHVIDPRGNPTEMTYTPAGLVESVTDALGNTTGFDYDARGNRTAVIDAFGSRTEFSYDVMNRLRRITYPGGTHTDFTYDLRGRRTTVTDANENSTTYSYDDADRLRTVTDALGQTTAYDYDTENNLTAITDALGRVTRFDYDADNRVTRVTFPSGLAETYSYDAVGNLTSKTDRKGQTISYA
jgi:YD repeat-containing protein